MPRRWRQVQRRLSPGVGAEGAGARRGRVDPEPPLRTWRVRVLAAALTGGFVRAASCARVAVSRSLFSLFLWVRFIPPLFPFTGLKALYFVFVLLMIILKCFGDSKN